MCACCERRIIDAAGSCLQSANANSLFLFASLSFLSHQIFFFASSPPSWRGWRVLVTWRSATSAIKNFQPTASAMKCYEWGSSAGCSFDWHKQSRKPRRRKIKFKQSKIFVSDCNRKSNNKKIFSSMSLMSSEIFRYRSVQRVSIQNFL